MAQPQHIHEGTGQALAPFLAQHPDQHFLVIELLQEGKEPPPEATEGSKTVPVIDAENAAALAYLARRIKDEATDDPEEIRKSEEEWEELKRNLNANRAATGERLVFP